MSNSLLPQYESHSKLVFTNFMQVQIEEEKMKICFRSFYEKIVFMQKRMKDQIIIRYSKVEVLYSAWDQVYACILRKATSTKRKDPAVREFLQ